MNRRGFTFIEILLTLLILMISIVPLLQLYATIVEETGAIDDMRTALDLGREEVEKVKNLALTEEQLKAIGNVVSPPIRLNRAVWFTVRVVDKASKPLRVTVFTLKGSLSTRPLVSLVTIIAK
ncbi:MAG: prepilin-type N-terminal cleavage/methylation domain-containing protein [Candidatus Omnitrophica bacterium]|nr:prepilin-type N-terminal cleavage/methylation domain-containing protein [Candidatus Omnitrophota bacterium]